jgi:hypothetical protein
MFKIEKKNLPLFLEALSTFYIESKYILSAIKYKIKLIFSFPWQHFQYCVLLSVTCRSGIQRKYTPLF